MSYLNLHTKNSASRIFIRKVFLGFEEDFYLTDQGFNQSSFLLKEELTIASIFFYLKALISHFPENNHHIHLYLDDYF